MSSCKLRTLVLSSAALSGLLAVCLFTNAQTTNRPIATFTATTANVGTPGQSIRIDLFAWSADSDRDQLVKAWSIPMPPPAPPTATASAVAPDASSPSVANDASAARGRRGNRGNAAAAGDAGSAQAEGGARGGAAAQGDDAQAAAGGRGGRGARGARGARGGGGLPDAVAGAPPPPPLTPSRSLAGALQKAPTVGILWTPESAGYSIRYAYRLHETDGSERIILATDRRLSPWNALWKPTSGTAASTDYEFSIIELRLNAQGLGEGKASLATPIAIDSSAKSVALENYASLPVVFKGVKRQSAK